MYVLTRPASALRAVQACQGSREALVCSCQPSSCYSGCVVGHLSCQLQDVDCQHIKRRHGEGWCAGQDGKVLHQDAIEHLHGIEASVRLYVVGGEAE